MILRARSYAQRSKLLPQSYKPISLSKKISLSFCPVLMASSPGGQAISLFCELPFPYFFCMNEWIHVHLPISSSFIQKCSIPYILFHTLLFYLPAGPGNHFISIYKDLPHFLLRPCSFSLCGCKLVYTSTSL